MKQCANLKRIVFLCILIGLCVSPAFSQKITVESSQLEQIIRTEVQAQIAKAIDESVSIAVKEIETKYLLQLAEKDKKIIEVMADLEKEKNNNLLGRVTLVNLQIDFDNYKTAHGIKRDFTIGGISLGGGMLIGSFAGFIISQKLQ